MARASWGFITNHALVVVFVVRHPESTVREVAAGVGVTERATLAILRELDDEGIIVRHRSGRRNTYTVNYGRLAAYRREGTMLLTPRQFIDPIVRTLLSVSGDGPESPRPQAMPDSGTMDPQTGSWGFLTHHLLLLVGIAIDNESTVRELAAGLRVTERAVVALLNQLEAERIVIRRRQGRRNSYLIDLDALRAFSRWSPGEWKLPAPLIEVTIGGLRDLADGSGAIVEGADPR